MRRDVLPLAVAACALAGAAACGGTGRGPPGRAQGGRGTPPTPQPSATPVSSDGSAAQVIEASPGDVLVRLPETPTSGYRWQAAALPDGVTLVDDHFTPATATAPVAGASGERVFRLRVPAPGAYALRFELKRAWESRPVEVRGVRLAVTPAP